jgi:hypothetical protein
MGNRLPRHPAFTAALSALSCWGALAASLTAQAGALNTSNSPIKLLGTLQERYDDVPVGGRVDMGLFFGEPDAEADIENLRLAVPTGPSAAVCLELNTIDGAIWARGRYDLTGRSAGIYKLQLPLTRASRLRRYRSREVAVRVHESSCETQGGQLFLVTWQRSVSPGATRRCWLQLNSDAFETTIAVSAADGAHHTDKCTSLTTHLAHRTFNQECLLQFPVSQKPAEAIIERRTAGSFLPQITLRVMFP